MICDENGKNGDINIWIWYIWSEKNVALDSNARVILTFWRNLNDTQFGAIRINNWKLLFHARTQNGRLKGALWTGRASSKYEIDHKIIASD